MIELIFLPVLLIPLWYVAREYFGRNYDESMQVTYLGHFEFIIRLKEDE